MDALTKKAVAEAREGRWGLLDAMELIERAGTDCTVVCLAHQVGDLALIGHCEGGGDDGDSEVGGDVVCTFCDGEGDLQVEGKSGRIRTVTCPDCEGHGLVDRDDADLTSSDDRGEVTHWRRLNGERFEFDLAVSTCFIRTMTIAQARDILATARKALDAAEQLFHG
jgi:hypothetical protein